MNLKFEIFDMTDTSLMTEDMTRRSRRDKLDKSDKIKTRFDKIVVKSKSKIKKRIEWKTFKDSKNQN